MNPSWYRWTKGPPGIYRSPEAAMSAWNTLDVRCSARHGQGASTEFHGARLYECRTRELARNVSSAREVPGVTFLCEM